MTAEGNTTPPAGERRPGGLPWEPRTTDLGIRIVDDVGHSFTLDEEWSIREPRGFTWWGGDFAQHVWSEPGVDDDGFEIFRLHAQTELLTDFDPTLENLAHLNDYALTASTSGYLVDADAGTVRFAASMHAHEETEAWVSSWFKLVTAMQASEAQITAGFIGMVTGASAARTPHPVSGPREGWDEMLFVLRPIQKGGEQPSFWEGEELGWTTEMIRSAPDTVLATGDATGLSAEFPFQSRTSLLRVTTRETHPTLGNGVLAVLHLPMVIDERTGIAFAAELFRRELCSPARAHCLGAWCWEDNGLHFTTFLPNVMCFGRGDLLNVAASMAGRARWVAETFYGDDWEANRDEARRPLATASIADLFAGVDVRLPAGSEEY